MRTAVLLIAVLSLLQGPVCPMSASAMPSPSDAPSAGHDCCPGGDPAGAPSHGAEQQHDGAAMAACAAHCASLVQAVAVTIPFFHAAALPLGAAPPSILAPPTPAATDAKIPPHARPALRTIPLLI